MRKNLLFTPLMALIASGAASAVYAQDTTSAVLAGKVTDHQGQPLAGVRVFIESPALLGTRQVPTDARGEFRVQLLPNGTFTITYTLNGYITRKQTLRLVAGQTANGSVSLTSITTESVEIEIEGERVAQVDKTDTVVQTVFDADFLEKTVGRGIGSISRLAPGLNTSVGDQGTLRIRGGTGHGNKFILDGGNITDGMGGYLHTVPFTVDDLIESTALIQSPINSRYGNSDGGIVSVVTSRGSNTFTGTIRANVYRNFLRAADQGYGSRDRDQPTAIAPNPMVSDSYNDVIDKDYEVSVQGPLWKDRITFAYGAQLYPVSYTQPLQTAYNSNTMWLGAPNFQANSRVGTYYEENGVVIRRPELYLYGSSGLNDATAKYGNARRNRQDYETYNQFVVYAQITPEHQVEYKYSQYMDGGENNMQADRLAAENADWNKQGRRGYNWNLGYKGIIGASGVIDARYGKQFLHWWYGTGLTGALPVQHPSMASRVPLAGPYATYWNMPGGPIDDRGTYGDKDLYLVNGLLGGLAANDWMLYNMPQADYQANPNAYHNLGNGTVGLWGEAFNNVEGGYGGNTSFVLNYQHFLNTDRGTHILDGGVQFEWRPTYKSPIAIPQRFYAAGRLAKDLSAADIYDPYGNAAPASYYAGKYIVFNARDARLSDIDPYSVARWNLRDGPIFAPNGTDFAVRTSGNADHLRQIMPYYSERFGGQEGMAQTVTESYYINDLWSINDYHSVQGGLRLDMFRYEDDYAVHVKYTQPTLRFEYKWDIFGDQSRMVNVSWGQFHSAQPVGLYGPLTAPAMINEREWYWTGDVNHNPNGPDTTPYLVDYGAITNPGNYRHLRRTVIADDPDGYQIDPGFKAPISTEVALGFRSSIPGGGSWKLSLSYRTWDNEFDYYPGEAYTMDNGLKNIPRILKNSEGYDRTYTGVELEWDLPITKKITFGGSYTYNRMMSNTPDKTDTPRNENSATASMDWWWDEVVPGGRQAWRPTRAMQPEHYIKWYLLFDLSRGKLDSSLSFSGTYTSATWRGDYYYYNFGYPYNYYPDFFAGPGGGAGTGVATAGTTIFGSSQRSMVFNVNNTNQDIWDMRMRYLLAVPLVRKITWLATIEVRNPFNHRGWGDYFQPGGASNVIVPVSLPGGAGANNIYSMGGGAAGDNYSNLWRNEGSSNAFYTARQGGRSFTFGDVSFQTGLRF